MEKTLSNSLTMQNNPLLLIEEFSETISAIFKSFSQICKAHAEKVKEARPEYARLEREIVTERKRRMELEAAVRERLNQSQADKPTENWRRPRNGFQLYMEEERNRILKDHPSLDNHKVATLASIKWGKMKREQQMAYERKVQEMNQISDEELRQATLKMQSGNDAVYIKKEYNQEEEANNDNSALDKDHEEDRNESSNARSLDSGQESHARDNNFDDFSREEQLRMNQQGEAYAVGNNSLPIQNTIAMENEYDHQPTLPIEQPNLPQQHNQNNPVQDPSQQAGLDPSVQSE